MKENQRLRRGYIYIHICLENKKEACYFLSGVDCGCIGMVKVMSDKYQQAEASRHSNPILPTHMDYVYMIHMN